MIQSIYNSFCVKVIISIQPSESKYPAGKPAIKTSKYVLWEDLWVAQPVLPKSTLLLPHTRIFYLFTCFMLRWIRCPPSKNKSQILLWISMPLIPALGLFPLRVKVFNKSKKPDFILKLTQSPWLQWTALNQLWIRVCFNFSPLWPWLFSMLKAIKLYFILPPNITFWLKLFSSGSPYFISLNYTYRNSLLWLRVSGSWPIPLHYSHRAAKIIFSNIFHFIL